MTRSSTAIPYVVVSDPDGSKYYGQIVYRKRHGKGFCRFPDGAFYQGDWVEGKMQGKGVYKFPDGKFYYGEFKDNKIDGNGICCETLIEDVADENRQVTQFFHKQIDYTIWEEGELKSLASLRYDAKEKRIITGHVEDKNFRISNNNGLMFFYHQSGTGYMLAIASDGRVSFGEAKNYKWHGVYIFSPHSSADFVKNEYEDGEKILGVTGKIDFYYYGNNRSIRVGWFKNDRREFKEDEGIFILVSGAMRDYGNPHDQEDQEKVPDGVFQFDVKVDSEDGSKYRSDTIEGKFWGKGTLYDKNGKMIYQGEFLDGLKHGWGVEFIYDNNEFIGVHEGEFKEDLQDGLVIMYRCDGSYYEGMVKQDMRCGCAFINFSDETYVAAEFEELRNGACVLYDKTGAILKKSVYLNGKEVEEEEVPEEKVNQVTRDAKSVRDKLYEKRFEYAVVLCKEGNYDFLATYLSVKDFCANPGNPAEVTATTTSESKHFSLLHFLTENGRLVTKKVIEGRIKIAEFLLRNFPQIRDLKAITSSDGEPLREETFAEIVARKLREAQSAMDLLGEEIQDPTYYKLYKGLSDVLQKTAEDSVEVVGTNPNPKDYGMLSAAAAHML